MSGLVFGTVKHLLRTLAPRGERGVLDIPAAQMLRLRWNPFYAWMENHTLQFLQHD